VQGTQGFPIDNTWLPSPTTWSAGEFTKLIRTYRARIRTMSARTPAERGALDWTAILADVNAGITADHLITTSTTVGPGNSWRQQYESFTTWHQMPPFFIGMADKSGSYAAWIAQPLADRGAGNTNFFMITDDQRFPAGATRTAQQADLALANSTAGCGAAATPCKRYFMNRPAADDQFSGNGWGWSQYDFVRFHSWQSRGDAGSARNGNTLWIPISEMNLIKAEALFRAGNFAGARDEVNKSRTAPLS